ncbi:mitochondrial 37s ribosomal protein sws2 [Diplodia corticola]|uniref:Mitochondrial 37s ribosomal protein sws2 n=1 Tax=Diplodia corticola TaxID=236234 RepID=A0A1J9S3J5_9PEZI|nr:mitochondrial 37s ribosomal protein sws2 [Diplodia corticola]OJD35127.1 mitochondrial 37s ribosomal protein sws2 [Diplodia corticola]
MVFILGLSFAEGHMVKKALQSFYGIGPSVSKQIMGRFLIHQRAKVGELEDQQVLGLNAHLSTLKIENDLRRSLVDNIQRLRDMGTYRGRRHAMNLPVRGQRTRSQISTARRLNKIERKG